MKIGRLVISYRDNLACFLKTFSPVSRNNSIHRQKHLQANRLHPFFNSCLTCEDCNLVTESKLLSRSLGNSDLPHVTSVGEVVIARAHVTVLPRLLDAETRRVARGWGVVKLSLQVVTAVTTFAEVKIQLGG